MLIMRGPMPLSIPLPWMYGVDLDLRFVFLDRDPEGLG